MLQFLYSGHKISRLLSTRMTLSLVWCVGFAHFCSMCSISIAPMVCPFCYRTCANAEVPHFGL
uniref:Uncharacterized protein n=1 Tax=Arundo donax TaxID=35708 RepID=A0A0A8XZK4_ARUDO